MASMSVSKTDGPGSSPGAPANVFVGELVGDSAMSIGWLRKVNRIYG